MRGGILLSLVLIAGLGASLAAEVELARGGLVTGWAMVRTGWEEQPVLTVSGEVRQWQYDLLEVRRITVVDEGRTLATKKEFLRERPAANSRAVVQVYPGFEFEILKEEGAWLEVKGYTSADVGYFPKEATSREVRFTTGTHEPQVAEPPAPASPEAVAEPPVPASPEIRPAS